MYILFVSRIYHCINAWRFTAFNNGISFSSSCVLYVASFSELSILHCLFDNR